MNGILEVMMSAEANKAVIRQWVETGWNHGDFSTINNIYAADYAYNDPSAPPLPKGPQAIMGVVSTYRGAFPDVRMTIEDMVSEGDKVVWRWTVTGTHNGPLMGIPASGKSVRLSGIVISRFVNGKWAEDWANWDTLGMLQQIGAAPVPN
jgi:steroid delta-isomerase-like uncharacterized protein